MKQTSQFDYQIYPIIKRRYWDDFMKDQPKLSIQLGKHLGMGMRPNAHDIHLVLKDYLWWAHYPEVNYEIDADE